MFAVLLYAVAFVSSAQDYPVRAVKIIVPFAAGGPADVYARFIAQRLQEAMGQPFVVEDRPGGGSVVGTDVVAKSPPDGYTLLLGTIGTNAINAALYSKLPYDVRTDFAPVTLVARTYLMLVMHPSVPVRTVKDVIALAKAKPGQLNFGSAGAGTTPHLAGEMFKYLTGV
ncbi:MAG TPA: tripartite tricarboxylate transporter substrate-binding protein, partial [Casimicrobiaceae bacterium]|nr:tripartite tricarboxylate transporter substrate-binding protein [Casimicrobiaceae bacterium]